MLNFYFVCDNRLKPLYNWSAKPMNGDGSAKEWLEQTKNMPKYKYILSALWRETELFFPISDWWEIVTDKFIDFLTDHAQRDMLRDSVFQIWKIILESFEVVVIWWEFNPITCFLKKWEQKFVENNYVITEAKEMMDWYHNLTWFDWFQFCLPTEEVMYEWLKFTIEWAYAPMLRALSFETWEFFAKTLKDTWQGKYLQDFQVDVLKNMGKYTFFTVIRQVGKTLLLSWIAIREVMKYKGKWKKTRVVFISNDHDAWEQVKEYIQELSVEFNEKFWGDRWRFEAWAKKVQFTNGKKWNGRQVFGEIWYFSAQGRNPGTGKNSDLIIGDEINLWPEKVWDRNKKVIENRPTRFIGATTMYEDTDPNHWSNRMLKKWESAVMKRWPINEWIIETYKRYFEGKSITEISSDTFLDVQMDNQWVWLRYSGEDVEILNPRQKAEKIKSYEWNEEAFLVEWCGVYPDDIKVFTFDHVIKEIQEEDYDNLIIWYDPSAAKKRGDEWGFVVWYVKKWILKTVKTPILQEWDFDYQCDQVIKFISEINVSFMLIIDTSWFWWAIVWQRFDRLSMDKPEVLPIENYIKLSTSWWNNTNRLWDNHYSCPLKIQVWFLKNALYNEKVIFSNKLEKLFSQMRKYKKMKTKTWADTWNWGRWDDFVSALLMIVWYFYEVLGVKDEAFDDQAMKMIKRKTKTEQEISDEIEAKLIAEQQLNARIASRSWSNDIY